LFNIQSANELGNLEVGKLPLPQGLGDKPQVQPIKSVGKVSIVVVASPIMLESKAQEADSDALGLLGVGMDTAPKKEPAVAGKKRVGSVQIGFNLAQLEREVGSTVLTAILFCLLALAICLVLAYFFSRMLTVPIERLVSAAAGIARGELQQEMAIHGNDEISDLARAFATMSDGLRSMIADLRGAAQEIEREASNILSTSSQQSAMASQQASAINETSTTVSEIAQTSKQATEHADSVIQLAQRSEELSRDGQKVVEEAMTGMEKLAEQVRAIAQSITELSERTLQIGDIIATVKDLAEQSNLLALNASIEAAKAGEHGRGFAVVAMEMRNLAEQSKVAAGEVRVILGDVQKGTRGAVGATEEGSKRAHAAIGLAQSAGTSILGLADVIRDSSLAARQIANNTRQQTIGVEQIVSAISELSSAMADTLEGTKRIENVAGSLTTLSKRLSDLVGRYQV
jgi:methyl-accepting chemotaxis protein